MKTIYKTYTAYKGRKEKTLQEQFEYRVRQINKRLLPTDAMLHFSFNQYIELLEKQQGVCSICKKECSTNRALAIDHNHKTGHVRGLLCFKCNRAVGLFNDDPIIMQAAQDYVLL